MPERRVPVASILLEASFVVLGVFLALALNEWRAETHARDRAVHARTVILDEAQDNREAIQQAHDYHAGLLDSLRTLREVPSPVLFREGFVRPATIRSTAWDAATATDAVSAMDYADVLAFSELYAAQERYQTVSRQAGGVIYAAIYEDGVPGVAANARNLSYLIGSFLYLERGLIAEYDSVLVALSAGSQ